MTGNFRLKIAMDERGFSQCELAKAVNAALREAGERDSVGERTVRTWLTGKSRWPHRAKREALEAVFRCTAEDLGFYPPDSPAPPPEDPDVIRRKFLASAGATAAAVAVPLIATRPAVGTSDVIKLRDRLDALTALDAERGGHAALERAAVAGAREAVELQKQSATGRIRQRLFSIAADFTAIAAWSCIDGRQLDQAGVHLDRAVSLAGLSQNSSALMQAWNLRALHARQRKEFGEAIAAAQAAQSTAITRRDPLYASLAHARIAIGHANIPGERRAALRSLGYAEEALSKADREQPRSPWIAFYGPAELYAITAIVRDQLGDPAEAEAASYKALAKLPEPYRRNRAHATTRLALTQLHQGDLEQACDTTAEVFAIMAGDPLPGRMRSLLGDFHRDLITRAPAATVAREWADRYRTQWSTS
ncbi:XRE family transcriptional regulator [Streptomyces sp. MS1.AVA.4]|uniref:XRE family transcriptional regulator n=1 Tax=Streptomyces pratisoli TaxID=3139917 RepID=A0ACC6QV70_9ACTN